jgi:ribosomal protein L37E
MQMVCRNHPKKKEKYKNTGLCNECFEEKGREIYNEQKGICVICGKSLGPSNVAGRVPSEAKLDHNHNTGQIRGVLCNECNLKLGKFYDDPSRLRKKAAEYLENWSKKATD